MTTHPFIVLFVAAFGVALVLTGGGCGEARMVKSQSVLFDAAHPAKEMFHVTTVADPFAGGGAGKVLMGGPLGKEEPYQNKGTFISGGGFFKMPASGQATLHVRVAMVKLTDLKVEVTGKDPAASQKFRTTVPAADKWQEVVLQLDPKIFKPGCTVFDITIFQVGKDKEAKLYVGGVTLRTE